MEAFAQFEWLEADTSNQVVPSDLVMKFWLKNFMGHQEVWLIQDKEQFRSVLELTEVRPEIIKTLMEKMTAPNLKTAAPLIFAGAQRIPGSQGGQITLPDGFKQTLTQAELQTIYRYLHRTGFQYPTFRTAPSIEAMIAEFSGWPMEHKDIPKLMRGVVPFNDQFFLQATPEIWKIIPDDQKRQVLEAAMPATELGRQNVHLIIVLKADTDLMDIAKKLDSGGRAQEIFDYLAAIKPRRPGQELRIPLQEVLMPFVRETLGRFMAVQGANCFDCARRTALGENGPGAFLNTEPFEKSLREDFIEIKDPKNLRIGDVIVYHVDGRVMHAATYVSENYVFTKNGPSVFNPFIFQPAVKTEMVYSQFGQVTKTYYRSKANAQQIVGRRPIERRGGYAPSCKRLFQF